MYTRPKPQITFWTIAGAVCLGILTAHLIELTGAYVVARYQLALVQYEAEKAQKSRRQLELDRKKALEDMAAKKELAWRQSYQQPDLCASPKNAEIDMFCKNDYRKQRAEFEQRYGR